MERPTKRVRQACEPCRRKKSKCPGEKPTCSYCARLGQQCAYTEEVAVGRYSMANNDVISTPPRPGEHYSANHSDGSNNTSDTASRLNTLELQLAEVLSVLKRQQQGQSAKQHPAASAQQELQSQQELNDEIGTLVSPLWDESKMIAKLYLDFCHCQPLPLFHADDFVNELQTRDREVMLAVAALALRFGERIGSIEQQDMVMRYARMAGKLVIQRITSGVIELSTLQTFCLLALVEFYHSNTQQASVYISLAANLSQSSGLSLSCSNVPDSLLHEEQLRCFWSIRLLVKLHANMLGEFRISVKDEQLLNYPSSFPRPALRNSSRSSFSEDVRQSGEHKDLGVVAYIIQLSDVWQRAVKYARRRRQPENHPPWVTDSEYAEVLALQMHRESMMPSNTHRFKPANFGERSTAELNGYRGYWGPWLFNQMLYHAIICLINHPLLLSLRLRNFRVAAISEIWLQHTDDLVAAHTKWIIHLIELTEAKSFLVSDPFLAHFAAIVATIYLQQSFVDDPDVQQAKRDGYLTCLRFCEDIGRRWPHVQKLALKLRQFEEIVSTSYQNSAVSNARDKVYIDLTIFWEILESSLISEEQDPQGLKLGSSLAPRYHPSANAEELNAHPLPEPSRLHNVMTPSIPNNLEQRHNLQKGIYAAPLDMSNAVNDDFAVLAQSYFAQGQDFVGQLDDWWTLSQV